MDVWRLYEISQDVDCDVRLTGKDENGNGWNLSAKSFMSCVCLMNGKQRGIDWNAVWCECDKDISGKLIDLIAVS